MATRPVVTPATVLGTTADVDDPGMLKRYAAGPMPVKPGVLAPPPKAVEFEIGAVVAPVEEPHRAMLLGQLLEAGNKIPLPDLQVLVWIARTLPIAALQARLDAMKEADREPAGTPNNYRPTLRGDFALGSLLGTLRAVSLVVLGPKDGAR